jgi:predicted phage-related endonuclease
MTKPTRGSHPSLSPEEAVGAEASPVADTVRAQNPTGTREVMASDLPGSGGTGEVVDVATSTESDLPGLDRSKYIGSSDAAMVADLSPWGSPLTVWNRLTGLVAAEKPESLRMWLGTRLEPIILDLYEARTGLRPPRILDQEAPPLLMPGYPFIGAHPDFQGLEVKTSAKASEWGEDRTTVTSDTMAIPLHYFIQVQHQMMVLGWEVIDVAVLLGHDAFRTYTVPADPAWRALILDAEVELWEQAQRGEMPAKSDPGARKAFLQARYPRETEPSRPATPEEVEVVKTWREIKRQASAWEAAEKEAGDAVRLIVGPAAGLDGLVSLRWQSRKETVQRASTFRVLRAIGDPDGE